MAEELSGDILSQAQFKAFDRQFRAVQAVNKKVRDAAVGTLNRKTLDSFVKKYAKLSKDQKKQTFLTLHGRGQYETQQYSVAELEAFQAAIEKTRKLNRDDVAGLPLLMLERSSADHDKQAMRGALGLPAIRSATMYKITPGGEISFRVTGSGGSKGGKQFYQVKIRMEDWNRELSNTKGTWVSRARSACTGRLSFDCQCGRHQYFLRYIATVSNCAVTPPAEYDFPKITNAKLEGMCCKHTLKALQQMRSPGLHQLIAKEMMKRADSIGYGSGKTRFLNASELARMDRARGSEKDLAAAMKAYKEFQKASQAFKEKTQEKASVSKRKEMEKLKKDAAKAKRRLGEKAQEAKAQKARAESAERALSDAKARAEQLQRDALTGQIGMHVMRSMFMEKKSREEALQSFAELNKMSYADVDEIARGAGV